MKIYIKNSCFENIHKLFFQSLVLYILALLISRSDKKTICIFCVSSHIFCQTSSNNSPNILIFPFHIIFRSHSNVKRVGRILNRRTQFYLLNFYSTDALASKQSWFNKFWGLLQLHGLTLDFPNMLILVRLFSSCL